MKTKTKEHAIGYLASLLSQSGKNDLEAKNTAGDLVFKLAPVLIVKDVTASYVKGLCHRVSTANPELSTVLSYHNYLQAAAIILGYDGWHPLMKAVDKSDLIPVDVERDVVPLTHRNKASQVRGGLHALAKGTHITWKDMRDTLRKLASHDMHPMIDAVMMEMQMKVGITSASDERGDMLFAIFPDPSSDMGDDWFMILGEKYRPPQERDGEYKTAMIAVQTYPLSNRIAHIEGGKIDEYSTVSIKEMVEATRKARQAQKQTA
jgi:hypothetical protein